MSASDSARDAKPCQALLPAVADVLVIHSVRWLCRPPRMLGFSYATVCCRACWSQSKFHCFLGARVGESLRKIDAGNDQELLQCIRAQHIRNKFCSFSNFVKFSLDGSRRRELTSRVYRSSDRAASEASPLCTELRRAMAFHTGTSRQPDYTGKPQSLCRSPWAPLHASGLRVHLSRATCPSRPNLLSCPASPEATRA